MIDVLTREPELRSLDIVRRARQAGYTGGKSALYSLIASLRPKKTRRFSGKDRIPGELSRHGFGSAEVRYQNGTVATVSYLVSRLEYSGFTTVSVVEEADVEALVRALIAHFDSMGGVPLLAVFDAPKVVALRWDREGRVEEWDPAFAYAAVELGIGVEVRARRGSDRGPGTNLGNWLKQTFFRGRTFTDAADIERQLSAWLGELNASPPVEPAAGMPAPVAGLADERQRLRPLRVEIDRPLRLPVVIGPRSAVVFGGHSYDMPAEAAGLVGTVLLYNDRLRVVAGRYDVEHKRPQARASVRSLVPRPRPTIVPPLTDE